MAIASPKLATTPLRYAFLLGRGRSGTTWIGQALNLYPGCHYKYEPFNAGKNTAYSRWLSDLACDDEDAESLCDRFDALARGCVHGVEYPPFIQKPNRPQPASLLRLAWQFGKVFKPAQGLYERYGRPRYQPEDFVLIKQVNFPNENLHRLDEVLNPWIVAILRNPFASVGSSLRFYQSNQSTLKTDADMDRVLELLPMMEEYGVPQFQREELAALSDTAFEALRWRIQTEPLARFTDHHDRGLNVIYEHFAAEPLETSREIFNHLGWEFDEPAMEKFVQSTTHGRQGSPKLSTRHSQYSIHRDPKVAVQRWRKDLSEQQIAEIRDMVANSSLLSLWPELSV